MKRLCVLLFVAAMAASMCSCVWFMDESQEESKPAVYEPVQDIVEATPEPERAENPVSVFYSGYYDACDATEQLFQSRLEGEASKEAADTLMYLAEHDLAVSQGRITFGWLLSTDTEGSFSSSVSGAAEGSGNITQGVAEQNTDEEILELSPLMTPEIQLVSPTPEQEEGEKKEYALNFQYASGSKLTGILTDDSIKYSGGAAESSTVEIVAGDGVWESTVVRSNGLITVLRLDEEGLHFIVSASAERYEARDNIYSWTSDSAGARRI